MQAPRAPSPLAPRAPSPLPLLPRADYFAPGLGANATKFVLHFDGGGECFSQPSCASKLTTSLGSSKYFAPSASFDGFFLLDPSPATNPGFASWSHVRIPYCTQDLHMGTRTSAGAGTWGLLFSGHLVYEAVLAELERVGGLTAATDIILTGDSAGGIATWPKLASTAARYPAARVAGAPIAGMYFFSYPYNGPDAQPGGLAPFSPAGMAALYALYQPALDAACVAALPGSPGACMLSNNSLPFIAQDVFVTEAQSDSVQLTAHDNINAKDINNPPERAYIGAWAANMSVALAPVMAPGAPRRGAFSPACFIHTSFSAAKPLIQGKNFLQAAAAWYSGAGEYKLADSCGLFCGVCP